MTLQFCTIPACCVPHSSVESLVRGKAATGPGSQPPQVTTRLADQRAIVAVVAAAPWAAGFRQIPATVIDVGVMRNIPYKSHRAGRDYEINIYGDPNSPAGFEIGVHGDLVNNDTARQGCIDCLCRLLGEPGDQRVVAGMDREKDLKVRNGLTFEVTPPTAPDAYGGWWISAYDEEALDKARATQEEMRSITVARSSVQAPTAAAAVSAAPQGHADADALGDWSSQDLRFARAPAARTRGSTGGDRVYVGGYTRKDGTYVHSHTRTAHCAELRQRLPNGHCQVRQRPEGDRGGFESSRGLEPAPVGGGRREARRKQARSGGWALRRGRRGRIPGRPVSPGPLFPAATRCLRVALRWRRPRGERV